MTRFLIWSISKWSRYKGSTEVYAITERAATRGVLRWVDEERGSSNRLHIQLYWALLFAVPTVFVAPYLWMKFRFQPYSEQIQLCQYDVRIEGTRDTTLSSSREA